MGYKITLVFMDGKNVDVNIEDHNLSKFQKVLEDREAYFNESKEVGFWPNHTQIRYAQFLKTEEKPHAKQESDASVEDVSSSAQDDSTAT